IVSHTIPIKVTDRTHRATKETRLSLAIQHKPSIASYNISKRWERPLRAPKDNIHPSNILNIGIKMRSADDQVLQTITINISRAVHGMTRPIVFRLPI